MGGFIHFESKSQQGLEAHITIPQGVADDRPAVSLVHPENLCIACYFRPERYSCDEVRGYYDKLIYHLVDGLGIEGYQAHNFEGLIKLQENHALTHVFIAQAEYEENLEYYEELSKTLRVGVIAERDFVQKKGGNLLIIRKPFFALSVANLLNGETEENGFEEAQAAGRRPFICKGVRVLAVDDEEMNLVVAKGVLGSYGIQVDTCLSGEEALERCSHTAYHMIFLDHMMPGFDGVETLRRIRELNDGMYMNLPVIALTANTISGAREMFRNEGFTEFIPKPIERAVLERVLRKSLPEECIEYSTTSKASEERLKGAKVMTKTPDTLRGKGKAEPETPEIQPDTMELETMGIQPDRAEAGLEALETQPDEAEAGLEALEAQPDEAEAGLEALEIQPDEAEAGLEALEIQPDEAEAGLEALENQPDRAEAGPEALEIQPDEAGAEREPSEILSDEIETEMERAESLSDSPEEEFPHFAP